MANQLAPDHIDQCTRCGAQSRPGLNRQAENMADQAAENMARIHQEIEDTKSAQTVALSEGEAVVAAASGSVADVQKNEDADESDEDYGKIYESPGSGWPAWWAEQNKKNCEFFGVPVSTCRKCSFMDCDLTKLGVRGRCRGTPFDPGEEGYYFVDDDHKMRPYPPPLPPPPPTNEEITREQARLARIAAQRHKANEQAQQARAGWQADLDREHKRQ
eukprot:SAG31_NODE_13245_length_882_cov_37.837803_1_plen_216_part_10